jgi:conjugal transfer pilus assembly protein TraW
MQIGLLVVLTKFSNCWSRDFGTLGKTYSIVEEDSMEVIQQKLAGREKAGLLKEELANYKKNMEGYIKRPLGRKLPPAMSYRAVEINLSYTLNEDLADHAGKILYKSGTTVNPLSVKALTKILCFIDGDSKKQVEWVLKVCGENPLNKMIIVSGNFSEVSIQYKKKFYFDQRGYLSQKLGINALPAVVRQSGSVLYLEEFPVF